MSSHRLLRPLTPGSTDRPGAEAPRALQSSRERAGWFTASGEQPFLRPGHRELHGDVPPAPDSLQGEDATGQTGNGGQGLGASTSPAGSPDLRAERSPQALPASRHPLPRPPQRPQQPPLPSTCRLSG